MHATMPFLDFMHEQNSQAQIHQMALLCLKWTIVVDFGVVEGIN